MAKLVPEEHPVLHQIAEEVPQGDIQSAKIGKVLKDMKAALLSYNVEGFNAVAIAAPQIGIPLRIFMVHDTSENRSEDATLPEIIAINPKITKLSKTRKTVGEGCLSVPEYYGTVNRAKQATLRAFNEKGEEYERGASGLLAQIFQHEVDHLDGTLFTDRAERVWHKDELEAQKHGEAE